MLCPYFAGNERLNDWHNTCNTLRKSKGRRAIFFHLLVLGKLLENCYRITSWLTCKRLLTAHSMLISTNPSAAWIFEKKKNKRKKDKSEKHTTPKISFLRMSLVISFRTSETVTSSLVTNSEMGEKKKSCDTWAIKIFYHHYHHQLLLTRTFCKP